MKIEKHFGCTVVSFTVDGVEWHDLKEKKQLEVLNTVFAHATDDRRNIEDIVSDLLGYIDYSQDIEICDTCGQCGDSVLSEYWEV
jgi:hypothetical protein